MSYAIKNTSSLEWMRTYVVGVIAGLLATPGLAELAGAWRQAKAEVVKARDARDDARDAEVETTIRVRVFDALWDRSLSELSGLAFLLAGRDATSAPYVQLFGTVKANDLQKLGPAKATLAGTTVFEKIAALGDPQLLVAGQALNALTLALGAAEEADQAAEIRVLTHDIERVKLLRRLERLIAETEAQILSRHPGRKELVRATLDTEPERRARKPAEEEEDVEPAIA